MRIWILFVGAALLEVAGDAVIRGGLRGNRPLLIAGGAALLTAYGILVNSVDWDFSRLLGAYVAAFAVVSVAVGHLVFGESIPATTWIGLAFILTGGLLVQAGMPSQ